MSNWTKHHPDLSSPNFAGRSIREFDRGYVPYEPEQIPTWKAIAGAIVGLSGFVAAYLFLSMFY